MKERVWAYIIGLGLVLFAVHNPLQPGKEYAFLPVVGLCLSLFGVFAVLQDHRKEITWGSKYLYIPMAVIALSIAGSGVAKLLAIPAGETAHYIKFALATTMFGGYLFGVYLTARILGKDLFVPFTWAVVIGALGCIGYGIAFPGDRTGGLISPLNYDIATGLLVFGTLVSVAYRQWWLIAIALVGLFFTGAEEALFCCAVVGVVVLIRRDFGRKMIVPVVAIILVASICWGFGITQDLYYPATEKVVAAKEAMTEEDAMVRGELLDEATGYRWLGHWSLSPIKPLGYGYNMTEFYEGIPHNIVLIIIEQVGILAAIAWIFVSVYCIIKTKWKYAWIGILALGVFDHFLFTQVAPWWWLLVGVSTASAIKSDLIFKEVRDA